MKRISPTPTEIPPKDDKLADAVAQHNQVFDGKCDPVELKEWIRGMEKIFAVVKVPVYKKVNVGMLYLTGETDILVEHY